MRSVGGAKRLNGSATSYVENCTPSESRETRLRRQRSTRAGASPTPPMPQASRKAYTAPLVVA